MSIWNDRSVFQNGIEILWAVGNLGKYKISLEMVYFRENGPSPIFLITKKTNASVMADLRPISLCSCTRLYPKSLSQRLSCELVASNQSTFL